MRRIPETLVFWACLAVWGCKPAHTAEHAENVLETTPHAVALEKCVDAYIASVQTMGDYDKAHAEYVACADAADKAAGLVKK